MLRHVLDLRIATSLPTAKENTRADVADVDNDELLFTVRVPTRSPEASDDDEASRDEDEDDSPGRPLPRRGSRERRPVHPFQYSDL